ncbi:MAG: hypothetical protein J6S85_20010 [Methanobrevibacter sp.]|nr:hypothetical protein [Methanobrevibacter sp.]
MSKLTYPFDGALYFLNGNNDDFIKAQKQFDKNCNGIDRIRLTRAFLEYLESEIHEYERDIPEHIHYLNEFVEKYAPTHYYEKIKPLEEATVREKIARKKKEVGFCKRIFERCEQDGSNLLYCIWLYNKGEFRTHKERKWAEGYIEYSGSILEKKFNKFRKIRNIIGWSIFLPFIPFGAIAWIEGVVLMLCSFAAGAFTNGELIGLEKFTDFIYESINKLSYPANDILYYVYIAILSPSVIALGDLAAIATFMGVPLILQGILAIIVMWIMTAIYKKCQLKCVAKRIEEYSKDPIYSLIIYFSIGAIVSRCISRHFEKKQIA